MPETIIEILARDYFRPNKSFEDAIAPVILSISGTISTEETTVLEINGSNISSDAIAIVYPVDESYLDYPIIENIYQSATKAIVTVPPLAAGNYKLLLINEDSKSTAGLVNAIAPVTEETTVEEMRSQGIILLNNLDKLKVGNFASIDKDVNRLKELDLLYYNSVEPKVKNGGIYTTSKGYLVFPQLAWNKKKENKTTSFIVYIHSDTRYEVFGLCSTELYNFNSSDYNKVEIGLRFRNYRGCYYQYGLTRNRANTFGYQGYFTFESKGYYRIDIENNGAKGEYVKLYQLNSGEFKDWFTGAEYVDEVKLANPPARRGQTYMPYLGEYLGSNNQLLGVVVS